MSDASGVDSSFPERDLALLRADCARCAGLCCVAPAFSRSADFALDKPAGVACPNLAADFRCAIHPDLRERGFAGCTVFDCFGAGQRVVQETFAGADWRHSPDLVGPMFATFHVMRLLHELLWFLTAALALPAARALHGDLHRLLDQTEAIARGSAADLADLDIDAHRARANAVLRQASALARAASDGPRLDRRGADLAGADLRTVDLRGADLRGAQLIGANLARANLALADLTGADVRGTNLAATDLGRTLFLTQPQLESARGDTSTVLPPYLRRPAHWR